MCIANAWPFSMFGAGPLAAPAKVLRTERGLTHTIGFALLMGVMLFAGPAAAADRVKFVTGEYMVSAPEAGIELFVRNKRPADMALQTAQRTVLFVHGSTYPASTSFDLPLDGKSWMDFIAERGFDVYLMDLRGYGRSTRPQAMSRAPIGEDPIVTTSEAVRDVEAVIDDILRRRQIAKLSMIGWSWGTSISASYAIEHPDKVERLVFYGPQWIDRERSPEQTEGKLGAYHTVSRQQARERWLTDVPKDKQRDLIPDGWFKQWADATFGSDPVGAAREPPVLRVPSGTVLDSQNYWRAGKAFYDPARIAVPVLLIHGEWDRNTPAYMSEALLPLLGNAPSKRHEVIQEATHMAMLEKNRMELFEAVQRFLEEEPPAMAEAQAVAASASAELAVPPEVQPGSSSGGGQPGAPPEEQKMSQAPAPSSGASDSPIVAVAPPQTPALDPDWLVGRGKALLQLGDLSAARLFFERAAAQGHAGAMRALAETFDPIELQRLRILGAASDPHRAIEWYRRAAEAGDGDSLGRVGRLSDRASSDGTGGGAVRESTSDETSDSRQDR
jgi:pimeloyl-ACP methyl ester carboxylesterase